MVSSMLIVGFTRGILILMKQGCITDTIVYGLVTVLDGASKYVAAYGMLFLQNIIKFFINGSTSQATITMPIMAPTAELVGLRSRSRCWPISSATALPTASGPPPARCAAA